jgi:putative transcriptional regulator
MQVRDREALKRWRGRRDLTQRQLAYLVGASQTTIHLLETGGMKTLTEKLALSIAKRLDVPWEDIFEAREAARVPGVTDAARSTDRIPA